MRWKLAPVLAFAVLCLGVTASAAEARGFGRFGEDQKIHEIQPLTIPASLVAEGVLPPEWNEGAQLGYMVTTHWFVAGLYMSNDGYVIHQPGSDEYWSLDDESVAELQELNVLPDPLPAFQAPVADYAFGYSLWLVITALILWYGGRMVFGRKKAVAAADDQAAA
jgi:hypothetical protein